MKIGMEEIKKCPYCGEEILIVAKKCKHCGEWLEEIDPPPPPETIVDNNEEIGSPSPIETALDKSNIVNNTEENLKTKGFYEILKVIGSIVIFLALLCLIFGDEKEVPFSIVGKWESKYTVDLEDWGNYSECQISYVGIDECRVDGTDIETGIEEFRFSREDENGDSITVVIRYETTYTGEWEQYDEKVIFTGKDYKWNLTDFVANSKLGTITLNVQDIRDDDDFKEFGDAIDEYFSEVREGNLERRELTLSDIDYSNNTITLKDENEELILTKIDGDIPKVSSWKLLFYLSKIAKYGKGFKGRGIRR